MKIKRKHYLELVQRNLYLQSELERLNSKLRVSEAANTILNQKNLKLRTQYNELEESYEAKSEQLNELIKPKEETSNNPLQETLIDFIKNDLRIEHDLKPNGKTIGRLLIFQTPEQEQEFFRNWNGMNKKLERDE